MKTPQEVFKLMLEHWDVLKEYNGVCSKLFFMRYKFHDLITHTEYRISKSFFINHTNDAVKIFNASPSQKFWWLPSNQEVRKQFVKYLSEIE